MSGVVLPVWDVAVARRLGLHPEEDGVPKPSDSEDRISKSPV